MLKTNSFYKKIAFLSTFCCLLLFVRDRYNQQPARLAIIIDRQFELSQSDALTDDFMHLITQQASPVLLCGSHLFDHLVRGYRHCSSGMWTDPKSKKTINLKPFFEQIRTCRARILNGSHSDWQTTCINELKTLSEAFKKLEPQVTGHSYDTFVDDVTAYCTLYKPGPLMYEDFDRNWLLYRINIPKQEQTCLLLIPRRYLENYFDVDLTTGSWSSLFATLQQACRRQEIIDNNQLPCQTISDVLRTIGFVTDNTVTLQRLTIDTYQLEQHSKEISKKDFYPNLATTIDHLLVPGLPRWCMRVCGHGSAVDKESAGRIVGLSTQHALDFFKRLAIDKAAAIISLNSCYIGGSHRARIQEIAKKAVHTTFIIESSIDAPTIGIGPSAWSPSKLRYFIQKLNYFPDANSLCLWNALPFMSLPRNEDLFEGIEHYALHHDDDYHHLVKAYQSFTICSKIDKNLKKPKKILSNIPLIASAHTGFTFTPCYTDTTTCLITDHSKQMPTPIIVDNADMLFVEPTAIPTTLEICHTVPTVVSGNDHECLHTFDLIDARKSNAKTIDDFLASLFVHNDVKLASSRGFLIKTLIMSSGTYNNIYAEQADDLIALHYSNQTTFFTLKDDNQWHQGSRKKLTPKTSQLLDHFDRKVRTRCQG